MLIIKIIWALHTSVVPNNLKGIKVFSLTNNWVKHTCVEPASKGVNIMLSKLAHLLNGRLDGSRSPHSTVCPSTYVRRLPSINVLIQYSLIIWFDHTFLPKYLWKSLSAFCNYPQRCNLGNLFLPFALSPRFSPIGQTFQSLSISRR